MEKKGSKKIGYIVIALLGMAIGALLIWQTDTIKKRTRKLPL
jgi:hypothetical protein